MSVTSTARARAALAATAALAVGGLLLACVSSQAGAASTGLKTLAEAKGKYIGTELTGNMVYNSTVTSLAAGQFDMVTPGNEMKWDTT
ncbi:endo-1,4-beta-xylanase, partial [Kutzneria kofuensis]